jgi:hypothetical protein
MVASTVYNFKDQLLQICGSLNSYGYEVWNSHLGTVRAYPNKSNQESCVIAAQNCDLFLGIARPHYGSGVINDRSITHEEFRTAIATRKPRWFLVHRDVVCARGLLKPYMFTKKGARTKFRLKENPIINDLRVIDLYHDAIQNDVPVPDRKGHWVQEFYTITEALVYLDAQLKDVDVVETICQEMRSP